MLANDKGRKSENNKNKKIIKNTQDSYVFRIEIVLPLQQKVKGCPNLTSFQNGKYIRLMEVEPSNICTLVS